MANPSDTMPVLKNYRVGLNNVGSYQVAGTPYITGSDYHAEGEEMVYNFPMVTNHIRVSNFSNEDGNRGPEEVRVHFNSTGSSGGAVVAGMHYQILSGSIREVEMNVKCKRIYISAPDTGVNRKYRIVASLTQIPVERMYALTGSGLTTDVVGPHS